MRPSNTTSPLSCPAGLLKQMEPNIVHSMNSTDVLEGWSINKGNDTSVRIDMKTEKVVGVNWKVWTLGVT